jgi:hypothetical protein
MQFTKIGDLDILIRVTGPTHHLLGLVLSPGHGPEAPILERVSLDHPDPERERFDPERDVCREVLAGVQDANNRLGTHFVVTKIRYCADDPPVAGIYRRLAEALVEHMALGQETPASPSFEQADGQHDQVFSKHV